MLIDWSFSNSLYISYKIVCIVVPIREIGVSPTSTSVAESNIIGSVRNMSMFFMFLLCLILFTILSLSSRISKAFSSDCPANIIFPLAFCIITFLFLINSFKGNAATIPNCFK